MSLTKSDIVQLLVDGHGTLGGRLVPLEFPDEVTMQKNWDKAFPRRDDTSNDQHWDLVMRHLEEFTEEMKKKDFELTLNSPAKTGPYGGLGWTFHFGLWPTANHLLAHSNDLFRLVVFMLPMARRMIDSMKDTTEDL